MSTSNIKCETSDVCWRLHIYVLSCFCYVFASVFVQMRSTMSHGNWMLYNVLRCPTLSVLWCFSVVSCIIDVLLIRSHFIWVLWKGHRKVYTMWCNCTNVQLGPKYTLHKITPRYLEKRYKKLVATKKNEKKCKAYVNMIACSNYSGPL